MTPALPWLVAAVWAFAALLSAGSMFGTVTASIGLLACLSMAVQGWWVEFRAYEPEGRHGA